MYKGILLIFSLLVFGASLAQAKLSSKCLGQLANLKFISVKNSYATGFSIRSYQNFKLLRVKNPFQKKSGDFNYLLAKDLKNIKGICPQILRLKIPVEKIVALSTTHLTPLEELGAEKKLIGFSNIRFINSEKINRLVLAKKIREVGAPPNPEIVLSLKPDVVFAYATQNPSVEGIKRLQQLKIPVVFNAEYREKTPLARAEWIKFAAAFLDCLAKNKFNTIKNDYNSLKEKVAELAKKRPIVAVGKNVNGIWKAPSGDSDFVHLIKDAGADYIWEKLSATGPVSISLEMAVKDFENVQYWLPQNSWKNLKDMVFEDKRYLKFQVYKNKNIYNNNNKVNPRGGNDYWEKALMRPDLLLADLVKIFHPSEAPEHKLIWYKKLLEVQ